jgi:AcrR family transcriptional regulator
VVRRVPPSELTLATIAKEAGVTAALLVQRFGSKRALMIRLNASAADATAGMIEDVRARHPSAPLAALAEYVEHMAELAESPAAYMRNLAYLQEDLADAELHAHLVRQSRAARAEIEALLLDAVTARELVTSAKPRTFARALARTVEATISGSLMTWAFYREGDAARWIRRDVDAVLAPYRPAAGPRTARRRNR